MRCLRFLTMVLVCLGFLTLITSCEKAMLGSDPDGLHEQVFEYLWDDIYNRYAYFELKEIDWKEVKEKYQPMVYNGMSENEFFDVLADMLFELEDGHVNLTSPFNRSRNWEYFQNYPQNYNQGIIDREYLGKDFWITGPLRHQLIANVLYVNYRTFTDEITDEAITELVNRAQGATGVIIDVRSNGGGSLSNAQKLASAFTNQSYKYGSVRIKTGPCADCFSSWTDLSLGAGNLYYGGPVVVLTNRASYSSTTYFAEMMNQNPNATLMGSTTGGGGGTPAFGELPNGWTYRFSSTQTININGGHFETGIEVDVAIDLDKNDEDNGVDTIIEAALDALK